MGREWLRVREEARVGVGRLLLLALGIGINVGGRRKGREGGNGDGGEVRDKEA